MISSTMETNNSGKSSVGPELFGFDFWMMVSILAGGGALLLLLLSVLVICACCSYKRREKHQQDEEELRQRNLHASPPSGQHRSKNTVRGRPAPPLPQEEPINCGPTTQGPPQTQAQPKAHVHAHPPPPPQDEDEENLPPLPQPMKKHHRERRNQELY
ncbi:proline-rich protein 7-like [Myxocyprinus asiaticus]|uniref:proline-rich protein 7-like n=1 Tax=Myxocyprinus asiaticus TaxID=70543 RepID=UPI002223214C|nr:proline-rich protein 7-like [Myxocyprinus asiaticus]